MIIMSISVQVCCRITLFSYFKAASVVARCMVALLLVRSPYESMNVVSVKDVAVSCVKCHVSDLLKAPEVRVENIVIDNSCQWPCQYSVTRL